MTRLRETQMSRMSDLDLMVREGDRTSEDFMARGIDARTARAMADVVEASNVDEPEPVRNEPYDTLREFGLIDGEGFYTVHETKVDPSKL